MRKKWIIGFILILIIGILYLAQMKDVEMGSNMQVANLDKLNRSEAGQAWEPFYRVRATIIDGHSARISIPKELIKRNGKEIKLTGAGVFYGNGCMRDGDTITITDFFLLPSPGLAEACEIMPDIEMRWTVRVNLKNNWTVHYLDMIGMMATVKGRFRIDTSKPYEAVFYIDDAVAGIEEEKKL